MDLTTYLTYRPQMQTGDSLVTASGSLLSHLIRWRTRSRVSHVGLIVRLAEAGAERVFLLHAILGHGVVLVPLSRVLSAHRGTAWWLPLDHVRAAQRNPQYQAAMLGYALQQLGRPYDLRGVIRFVVPWIRQSATAKFCSELNAEALHAAGLMAATFVSPGQLMAQAIFKALVSLTE